VRVAELEEEIRELVKKEGLVDDNIVQFYKGM